MLSKDARFSKVAERFGEALLLFLLVISLCKNAEAKTYNVSIDGAKIDLLGRIDFYQTGIFSPAAFQSIIGDFSITATANGDYPYTFTNSNSTWGPPRRGYNITISVSTDRIELWSEQGDFYDPGNLFLLANEVTNESRENIRIFDDQLGFRMSNPPDLLISELVTPRFLLATAVNEPAPLALISLGLLPVFALAKKLHRERTDKPQFSRASTEA